MLQRSSTIVATTESLLEHAWGRLYSEAALARGITTDLADLTVASIPHKVLPSLQRPIYRLIAEQDKDLYAGLARAGFRHDFGEDGSGIHTCYLRRGAGYTIETGASRMIIEGKIKLAPGAAIDHFNARSVTLTTGTELPAERAATRKSGSSRASTAARMLAAASSSGRRVCGRSVCLPARVVLDVDRRGSVAVPRLRSQRDRHFGVASAKKGSRPEAGYGGAARVLLNVIAKDPLAVLRAVRRS